MSHTQLAHQTGIHAYLDSEDPALYMLILKIPDANQTHILIKTEDDKDIIRVFKSEMSARMHAAILKREWESELKVEIEVSVYKVRYKKLILLLSDCFQKDEVDRKPLVCMLSVLNDGELIDVSELWRQRQS